MPPTPQTAKLTSTLHLLIPRLRLLQKKSTASSVVQRRELAQLLENNRDASARIRVENVIATDIAVEVMEMVELYCELLLARAGVLDGLAFGETGTRARARAREEVAALNHGSRGQVAEEKKGKGGGGGFFGFFGGSKQPASSQPQPQKQPTPQETQTPPGETTDPDSDNEAYYLDAALDEASVAIFYAWSRFPSEVRELTLLRTLLADRYGKDFMNLASENKLAGVKVPERLVKGLRVRPPSAELVESYLKEIARAYGVEWGDSHLDGEGDGDYDDDVGGDIGDIAGDIPQVDDKGAGELVRRASETAELTRATPPRGFNPHSSPVSVAPPGPRSDNPNPRVKLPDDKADGGSGTAGTKPEISSPSPSPSAQRAKAGGGGGDKSGIPDLDELSKRFAALKR
ncbi:regulator of Vps4 activity in the MVB pathway-domain-containing protein [Aspergillus unguis]